LDNKDNKNVIKKLVIRYPASLEADLDLLKGMFGYYDRASKNKAVISGVRMAAAFIRKTTFKKCANSDEKQIKVAKLLQGSKLFYFPTLWERGE